MPVLHSLLEIVSLQFVFKLKALLTLLFFRFFVKNCRKSYNSAKTLETHNKSKKHLLAVEKYEQKQAELEEAGVENVAENVESTKTGRNRNRFQLTYN